ncbi:MAG: peptidoglycan DD-metalloendopeptidase family protein, partial [Bacteroidota bacterium]|nr:peptidoglycan DD-metalloendopeptidase family protein [Bacteroidota bacterium]
KSISKEIRLLDKQIGNLSALVVSLENDLENLKKEYASMVYSAAKASRGHNTLTFIFSANTFHQFLMRLKYMEQYSNARKNQVELIEKVKETLSSQRQSIEKKHLEQKLLLTEQITENNNLSSLRAQKSKLVKNLGFKEAELKKELADRKSAVDKLNALIADLVKIEIEKTAKVNSPSKIGLTPEAAMLSASFEGNKSKLLWPVASGFISNKFGKQPHPILKGVEVDNLGVGIQTNKGEEVRSVFDGKVKAVASVPGMNNVVIVQHGEYHTVYARLKTVNVKTGQDVKSKEILGAVYTDKDGITELQFQVWKNDQKLDPQTWLFKR